MATNNNKRNQISIKFDPHTLYGQIKGIYLTDHVWSQLYLIFSSVSNNIDITSDREFSLPWYEIRMVLSPFAKFVKLHNITVEYNDESRELIKNHQQEIISLQSSLTKFEEIETNIEENLGKAHFTRRLTNEQQINVKKLISLKHGADFSVPGAGKTSTLLAVHSILKLNEIVNSLLVIAPRNAFISWEDEINACFQEHSPEIIRLTGGKDKIGRLLLDNPVVALITYQQLPYVTDDIISFIQRNRIHLVLDESHRIKRGKPGVYYSAIISFADIVSRRDILTGTPMPQSVYDLKPQFDFLWPGINLIDNALRVIDDEKKIEFINEKIRPLYVRTIKRELGLAPLRVKTVEVELGSVQRELYELVRSEVARKFAQMSRDDIQSFRQLGRHVMRLLQLTSNPMLLTSNTYEDDDIIAIPSGTRKWDLLTEYSQYEKSVKITYIKNRVTELNNHGEKVVIWSSFIKNIQLLETLLSSSGPVSIYGSIKTGDEDLSDTREWRIREFHENPKCKVLIANPAACGEGISLHKICHHAIYLDRTFNAAHYLQSVDRIHRLGLEPTTETHVEILIAKDTIDNIVEKRLNTKIQTMGRVLDDPDLQTLAYDPEDIIEEIPAGLDINDIFEISRYLQEVS